MGHALDNPLLYTPQYGLVIEPVFGHIHKGVLCGFRLRGSGGTPQEGNYVASGTRQIGLECILGHTLGNLVFDGPGNAVCIEFTLEYIHKGGNVGFGNDLQGIVGLIKGGPQQGKELLCRDKQLPVDTADRKVCGAVVYVEELFTGLHGGGLVGQRLGLSALEQGGGVERYGFALTPGKCGSGILQQQGQIVQPDEVSVPHRIGRQLGTDAVQAYIHLAWGHILPAGLGPVLDLL